MDPIISWKMNNDDIFQILRWLVFLRWLAAAKQHRIRVKRPVRKAMLQERTFRRILTSRIRAARQNELVRTWEKWAQKQVNFAATERVNVAVHLKGGDSVSVNSPYISKSTNARLVTKEKAVRGNSKPSVTLFSHDTLSLEQFFCGLYTHSIAFCWCSANDNKFKRQTRFL